MNYIKKSIENLGYTQVDISGDGILKADMSNLSVLEKLTHTYQDVLQGATEENSWEDARGIRDTLLRESDWSAGTDVPTNIKEIMEPYRQNLRDITKLFDDASTVVFPVYPL